MTKRRFRPQTELIRAGLDRSQHMETSEALYLNSGYVYESAEQAEAAFNGNLKRYVYSRYANPTVSMLEERLAALEGAEACRATSAGMAAVFASLACQVKAGDRVVASQALFSSCDYIITNLLRRWGVETELVDGTDLDLWAKALSKPVTAVFLETPSNPTLEIIDLAAVADLTHKAGGKLVVDNVFASPVLQKPMELGADVVVYSATKHMDGQGRVLGGAILCKQSFVDDHLLDFYRHTGPTLSAFNAWVILKGLETLDLRVCRMSDNAARIARFLEDRNSITRVFYPGLASHPQHELAMRQMKGGGNMVAFELAGGKQHAFKLLNALEVIDISNNLGDAKSLITHPATTTHQRLTPEARARLGISDGLVRLSVGLEDVEDLIEDLDQALG